MNEGRVGGVLAAATCAAPLSLLGDHLLVFVASLGGPGARPAHGGAEARGNGRLDLDGGVPGFRATVGYQLPEGRRGLEVGRHLVQREAVAAEGGRRGRLVVG